MKVDKDTKRRAQGENRHRLTNFITDMKKIDDLYEEALASNDNSFIDELDHWAIAVTNELGVRKELEIIKLKKKNKKLKKKLDEATSICAKNGLL